MKGLITAQRDWKGGAFIMLFTAYDVVVYIL